MHKIGVYEFYAGKNYNLALFYTMEAMRINTSGRADVSPSKAVDNLYNVAFYYNRLSLLKKALVYYDSAILFAKRGPDIGNVIPISRLEKAYIYFQTGDYEKAVEESDRARIYALQRRDSLLYQAALQQRAQALCYQGRFPEAREDALTAIAIAKALHQDYYLASALKVQGLILSGLRDNDRAEQSFVDCIAVRIRSKVIQQVSADYIDLGAFYLDSLKAYKKAEICFLQAMQYARKTGDSTKMASASINLGRCYYYQQVFDKARLCFVQAIQFLKIGKGVDLTLNPKAEELRAIGNKDIIQVLFHSKTALLLGMYRQTHDPRLLEACLRTALLNDSLMREIRHEHSGEQSKLYWRNETRDFFSSALDACYLASDDRLAFYFMEESRSVLLQDKLNELGARAYLPAAEAEKGERLQIRIIELQEKVSSLADSSREGRAGLQELLAAKESLEQYIHALEKDYPAYYQYKYADDVQPLSSLQEYLSKNKQSFVEYFVEDTVCYMLCVQPAGTQFLRIAAGKPGIGDQMGRFLQLCADENALNRSFPEFLASANGLYRLLFEPFHLAAGRVIICQDNELVPFEALSAEPGKADFLIKDYTFSYVYSARYLLNQREQRPGRGDFLGIAPVSFAAYRGMADLSLSEEALRSCSTPYSRRKLLVGGQASRQNFIRQVGDYTTTTILTHARADSTDKEPLLFMNDSVVRLSELQMLKNPAARLVVLSACQTNAGKNRNGEGVFSLARGFSAAGIPAVAATQWMADEAAIYSISQKFNEYLFAGMKKDEALRKAKLFYMYEDKKGSVLPCYWADMILIGNAEPVAFSKGMSLWRVAGALGLGLVLGFFIARLFSGSYGFGSLRRKGYPGHRRPSPGGY